MKEACEPDRAKVLSEEEFAQLESCVRETSFSHVYTYHASIKDPLTEKVRKTMSKDVKTKAYMTLLPPGVRHFVGDDDDDDQILNLARDDYTKNQSTARPARLLDPFHNYYRSVGRIVCGSVQATCFLVTSSMVITNHHVYLDINRERMESNNPIKVFFDYLNMGQTENIVEVEVDETQYPIPKFSSEQLDYVFPELNRNLTDRCPPGPFVRNGSVHEGLVTVIGYPQNRELLEETCVIVKHYLWRHKLLERLRVNRPPVAWIDPCLHMCKTDIMSEKYENRLPYDTSLFQGSSGSPVFDMNGHIVAMHTQGYLLNIQGKTHSMMEFGIHFRAICEHIRRSYHVDVREIFPNYDPQEDMMDMN